MTPPALRKFAKGDRVFVRAQQVWVILSAQVMYTSGRIRNRLLEYGELAEKMSIDPRAAIGLGRELGLVGFYCIDNGLPGLNCIVIAKETGTPGPGVVHKGKTWKEDQREAFTVDWFQYRVPTTGTFRQVWEEHS